MSVHILTENTHKSRKTGCLGPVAKSLTSEKQLWVGLSKWNTSAPLERDVAFGIWQGQHETQCAVPGGAQGIWAVAPPNGMAKAVLEGQANKITQ